MATTCEEARAAIKTNCHYSEDYLAGLTCTKNPSCVLGCMAKLLGACKDVGCGFCSTCDCAGGSPFETCVGNCQK